MRRRHEQEQEVLIGVEPPDGTITIETVRAREIIWSYLRAGYDQIDAGPLATEIAKALRRG